MNNVQQPAERVIASVERVIIGKHMEVQAVLRRYRTSRSNIGSGFSEPIWTSLK